MGFKSVQGLNVTDIRWERVPEAGGRAAEGSGPHSSQVGWRDSEADGGGRSEEPTGCVDVEEVSEVWRSEAMDGLECEQ